MPKVVKRTFSLTEEQAKFIDEKVEQGGYASGSEVVRDGLRGLQEDAMVVDDWLKREILPVIDRLKAGTEKTYTTGQVRELVRRERQRLSKAAE